MPVNAPPLACRFWVTPQSKLDAVLAETGARHLARLTSDAASITQPQYVPNTNILMLEFNDITKPQPGLVMPMDEHIKALIDFHGNLPETASLILSCYAGISRSTAAAFILACRAAPKIPETNIAQALRRAAPEATPNIHMVSLADMLMGRQGRMTSAIEQIGRGEDAFEGTPFLLDIKSLPDAPRAPQSRRPAIHGEPLP